MGQLADNAMTTDARSKALTQRLLNHEGTLLAKLASIRVEQDEIIKQLDAFDTALTTKPDAAPATSGGATTPPAAPITAPV